MSTVKMILKESSYDIVIGHNILENIGEFLNNVSVGSDAVIITNPIIKEHYGDKITRGLERCNYSVKFFEVPAGEESKTSGVAIDLVEKIAQYDIQKKLFVLALGGGVVGDLAGFVAAVYKRGIPFVQVPTTLLAQLDSAIGGKVAVDLPMGKNLMGAFYQPQIVLSDVSVLSTLDKRQIRNGLAEAVKYGVISDKMLFQLFEKNYDALLDLEPKILQEVVLTCSRIKAKVVMSDEKETKGIRTILNYGHTIGHAIEAANQYDTYHHGEAVALGMRVAADISLQMGLLEQKDVDRINSVLTCIGLPETIEQVSLEDIHKYMKHDKKFLGKKNRFVLARDIGSVKVMEDIDGDIIARAVKKYLKKSF